jgi:GAF domain-containing protein
MSFAGSSADEVNRYSTLEYPIAIDPLLQEILRAGGPVVVADARTDPRTNKEAVAAHGNRTIINILFGYLDEPNLIVGVGTFAPEDVLLLPTAEEIETLTILGALVSVAMVRIRYLEEQQRAEAERKRLEAQAPPCPEAEVAGPARGRRRA